MDEKYIQDLYNVVVKNDPSFKVDISYDSFRQKMSDQNYAKKIYGWVSGIDQEFKNNNPEDQFMNLVSGGLAGTPIEREIKKKGNTGSSLGDGSLAFKRFDPTTGKIQSQTPEPESVDLVESEQQPEAQQPAKELSTGEYVLNSMNAVSRGFYKNLIGNPTKGLGTLLEQGTATIFGGSGKGPISDALIGFGTWFNNAIDEVAPQDDEFRGSLVDQSGQAVGQVLSLILTAGVGGMASKTMGAAAPALQTAQTTGAVASTVKEVASGVASLPGVSSALSVGQSEFERAKDAGATDDQAFEAFYKNAAVGSVLERLPVMQFFKRFNKASQGSVIEYIKTKGVAGLTGGVEEMTTEIVQQLYANKTAQEIYNINQELFEGVGESGGIGFGIGFLLNALGANARILRKNGKTAEANVIEQQISELENRAEKGGKSSYKVNGFPVNDPKIINDMIDKLNGADLSSSNIEISNDPELNAKLQNKIVDDAIKNQIRQASPDLNDASVNAIADLQKELNKLEGNTTQVAKDRAAEIRSRIKEIQANPITEEPSVYKVNGQDVKPEFIDYLMREYSKEEILAMNIEINNDKTGVSERLQEFVGTKPESKEIDPFSPEDQRRRLIDFNNRRISEIEELLSQPDNGKGTVTIDDKIIERTQLEKELQTLKTEIDAVQKQAAGQVSVQSGTGVGQEVAEGTSQAEPKVATQEGQVQEEVVDIESRSKNKDTKIEDISFNKEQTTVNDEGFFELAFEGSLLDDYDFLAQGSESRVYLSKDKSHVIKISEPYNSKDPNVYEKRVKIGLLKDILGNSGIEVIGYYDYNGTKNPIFRQDYVEGQAITEKEAEDYLRNNKKIVEIDNKFYTEYDGVIYRVSDFENNLIRDKNGNIVPIDLNISEVKDSKIKDKYDSILAQKVKDQEVSDPLKDVQSTASALNEDLINQISNEANIFFPSTEDSRTRIAESYHKAKADGSNPDLVRAVEMVLGPTTVEPTIKEETTSPLIYPFEPVLPTVETAPIQEEAQTTTQDPVQLAKENLGKRLSGDQLLDSQDLIDELNDNKAEIDEDGMVTVYHRTTADKKAEIERTGEMQGLEDGVFFSTKEAGQNQGYGDAVVKLKVPVEQLTLDDTFGDEAHLRIATAKAGDTVNVKEFIQAEPPLQEIGQELNETDLPGYNKMMNAIDGIIDRASRREGSTPESVMEGVIKYLGSRSQAYINATDVQREKIIRDVRKRFKKREKSAPSAEKITGKPKKQVTVDEMAALKDQIKLESKAAREAKADLNTKRRIIADAINKLATEGKVAAKKAEAMVKKLARLNVDSSTSVNKFIDYVSNVFQDAEYSSRLSNAKSLRSKINKISKNKDKLANLRDLGSKFTSIDPSMLTSEELVEYNEIADKVLKSIQGSTLKGRGKLVDMVVEADVSKYVDDVVKKQNEQRLKDSIDELSEMLGVELTEAEYIQLMKGENPEVVLDKKYDEAKMRASIQKSFDLYSTMIQESLRTGKDLFTGQEVNYSDNQKKTITAFMDMDLNYLNSKVALEAVDALMNFVNNGSTAKMDAILNKYNGEKNMIDALNEGVVSRVVRKLWSKGLGKVLIEQGANINIVFERVFGGFNRGQKMEEAMGVADLVNGKAEAQKEADNIIDQYVSKFFTLKPNNQLFNTAFNNIERGMGAWMSRNVFGTDADMRAEFQRRKDLILKVNADGTRTGTIAELEKGNEQEVEKAKIYQEVYDKILKDAESIEDVQSKMDKTNLEAVDFWQNKWRDKYQQLSDVALGVYNKVLEKDVNYIPDRFSKLSSDTGKPKDLLNDEMAFIVNSGTANIYKKETGVLMSATKPTKLPKDPDTGNTNRYVDLSFDSNNANAMYDALVDINTAGAIRQIDAAMNSDAFKKIMQDKRDAAIIQNRIRLYVANIRKKNPYSNDELTRAVKKLNRIAAIGVGQSLGGVTQPVKQTIPIVINTWINAGTLDFKSLFDRSKQDFINRSGRSIANRGLESQAQISTLNKMIDEVANTKGEKLFKAIEKINNWQLKNLLVKWDVGVARMSWMTYYQQALKKQGINPSSIDWSTHEVNEKAANYAQRQVDRQQNVSDADMGAELLSSKDSKTQLIMKGLMPFASFRMNQSARLGSDLSVLMNWKTSDSADRKIAARSIAGFAAEMATFRILSAGIAILLYDATKAIIGGDEDKEKRDKKIDAIIKGQLTSTVADTFSPLPLLDPLVQGGAASFIESAQDLADIEEEDRVSIYGSNKKDAVQSYGTFGIALDRALQLWEMGELIMGVGFKDDFGRTKYASQRHREALELLFVPAIMSNIGLAPSEVNSIVRNTVADAKRNASTVKGGKTKQQEQDEKFEKFEKEANKEKDAIATTEEIKVLEELISLESDSDLIDAANERIKELRNPDDEGFSERRKIKKAKKEELLGEYDNMTDMERYDPALFEERFGEYSEYYQENRGEAELDKKLNKLNRKAKDEERGYYQRKKK
jgi:hypothetical protein